MKFTRKHTVDAAAVDLFRTEHGRCMGISRDGLTTITIHALDLSMREKQRMIY